MSVVLISTVLSILWFLSLFPIGWVIGFGGGSELSMKIWNVIYFGGYFVLAVTLTFLFTRRNDRSFFPTLTAVVLPGILLWSFLGFSAYVSKKRESSRQAKYQEFEGKAVEALPKTTKFLQPNYQLNEREGDFVFEIELPAEFSYEFNRYILQDAFKFRIDNLDNERGKQIISSCNMYNHFVRLRKGSAFGTIGEPRYSPGLHTIYLQWWFDKEVDCEKNSFQSLLKRELIVRSGSEIIASFPIKEIVGFD